MYLTQRQLNYQSPGCSRYCTLDSFVFILKSKLKSKKLEGGKSLTENIDIYVERFDCKTLIEPFFFFGGLVGRLAS